MSKALRGRAAISFIGVLLIATGQVGATSILLAQGASLTLSPGDATADLQALVCNCPTATSLHHLDSSAHAYSNYDWANSDLADARTYSYSSTGDWIPGVGEVYYIKTSDNGLYKLRATGTNDSSGIGLEYEYLGSANTVSPPTTSWEFSTYDIIAWFNDTSAGAASWSWDFGDSDSSSLQRPRHVYSISTNPQDFSACMQASNLGGDGSNVCHTVHITEQPSSVIPPSSSIDLDGDLVNDLHIFSPSGCSVYWAFQMMGGSEWAEPGYDYRRIAESQALSTSFSTSNFCPQLAYPESAVVIQTSNGSLVKMWMAENTQAGGVRIEYAVVPPDDIFSNGFEGGNVNGWSTHVP